jgi:hypothetical protein
LAIEGAAGQESTGAESNDPTGHGRADPERRRPSEPGMPQKATGEYHTSKWRQGASCLRPRLCATTTVLENEE